ncbi:TatD family hydrolase [Methanohalophilus mahii]|uniref:TatD-related deoxyribonuclease n=1 Tax=Methanohalophilus mahii (strain ATCC 35705 / DSM 5219 / SLP) TaxID=547558 RepID=D5EAA8_METMS|nr:TatD family hydrolase [Methanohalophilus mahii]ADE36109.1 TatD-related deoxyribonuclease [Methanohalophilus mahii DSM 5219]
MPSNIPITDEHIHIDPRAKGIEAVKQFRNAGGTHMMVVSKPTWTLGVEVVKPEDYRIVFDETVDIVRQINEIGVGGFPVLGVHPAEITNLCERMEVEKAVSLMKAGLEIAAEYVDEGLAVGLKSGRPHYPVSDEVWQASNSIMSHAFSLGKDLGCAVQLHTESVGEVELEDIASRAKSAGIPLDKVVKHYAPPLVDVCEWIGLYPGVLAGKGAIEEALKQGSRFMMETDYIDDPQRPGAVLGPKTIPRRTLKLVETYGEEVFWKVHKENIEAVYEVDIEI